jgi:hypothetical protein
VNRERHFFKTWYVEINCSHLEFKLCGVTKNLRRLGEGYAMFCFFTLDFHETWYVV